MGRGSITRVEQEERIEFVCKAIGQGFRKSEIKRMVIAKYQVTARTVENYLARARERLREHVEGTIEDHRSEAIEFYQSILRSKDSSARVKVQARKRIDQIIGLDAPRKQEIAGKDGGPIEVAATRSDRDRAFIEMANDPQTAAALAQVAKASAMLEEAKDGDGDR